MTKRQVSALQPLNGSPCNARRHVRPVFRPDRSLRCPSLSLGVRPKYSRLPHNRRHFQATNQRKGNPLEPSIAVARCHEIHLAMGDKESARLEAIPEIGMAVHLALHIRDYPTLIDFEQLKLVSSTLLGIPRLAVERIVRLLGEIEFVKIAQSGSRITGVLPTVPYYDALYSGLGEYLANAAEIGEFEALTLEVVERLARSPHNADSLAGSIGADRKAFDSSVELGEKGGFLISRRQRSKTILLNPTYFSENAEIFADHVAKVGATSVKKTLALLAKAQGWPLSLIEKTSEIGGSKIGPDDILLLKRLAEDGIVKPPSIATTYAGESTFIFTPTPGGANLSPFRRDQYEKALAIVSAVRQGQLLPNRFAIRSPGAVLYTLKNELQLRPTSDYGQQYRNLVFLRIAQLIRLPNGYQQLKVIDTPDNREALKIAYNLVSGNDQTDLAIDSEAAQAMSGSQEYVESLVSAKKLRERGTVTLSEEGRFEMSQLLLEGM